MKRFLIFFFYYLFSLNIYAQAGLWPTRNFCSSSIDRAHMMAVYDSLVCEDNSIFNCVYDSWCENPSSIVCPQDGVLILRTANGKINDSVVSVNEYKMIVDCHVTDMLTALLKVAVYSSSYKYLKVGYDAGYCYCSLLGGNSAMMFDTCSPESYYETPKKRRHKTTSYELTNDLCIILDNVRSAILDDDPKAIAHIEEQILKVTEQFKRLPTYPQNYLASMF